MFYEKFISLCEKKGKSPSSVLRSLGYSPTSLKKWREGGAVTSTIVDDLAKYFDVPITFFYYEDDEGRPYDSTETDLTFKSFLSIVRSHTDYIVSLISRKTIYEYDLNRIAEYMHCKSVNELIIDESIINKNNVKSDGHTPQFIISEILSCIPGSADYRYLQVQISKIILDNLKDKGIDSTVLKNKVCLVHRKIDKLYNKSIDDSKKKGLNYSDVVNIARKLDVSIEYMLTGDGYVGYVEKKDVYIL